MNETLKTILLVSVSMVLILLVFLGGYLLGRFSGPFQHTALNSSMGWSMYYGDECPHDQLPYPHMPGPGMLDQYHRGDGHFHDQGMPFWDQMYR